jgi:hypothetical protein
MSRPLASIGVLARTETTRLTSPAAPLTVTCAGSTTVSPISRPAGGVPRSTATSTVLVIDWSSTIWIVRGLTSMIVTRGSIASTLTRTLTGTPSGLTSVRSTVARKSTAVRRPAPVGARYRTCSTSLSSLALVITVPEGWLTGVIRMGPG